jgi:hypothetical protein
MSWWFHLLIRKVDSLVDRCRTMEHVVRAVGVPAYVLQCEKLLVTLRTSSWENGTVWKKTVNHVGHSVGDSPTYITWAGTHAWLKNGKRRKCDRRPHSVWMRTQMSGWYGAEYVKYPTAYSDEQLRWLR